MRIAAVAAVALAAVAIAVILTGGGGYVVHARFVDAGQLVKGGLVEVGGRSIGTVGGIRLTDDNQADVELEITDDEFKPLHRGTVARVRTVGLSGVANRFVEIEPGPAGAPEIPDDGVMSTAETRPIVDLDVVLNSLDDPTRRRLQRIIRNGASLFDGTAAEANRAFAYLSPALAQSGALAEELARDRVAVERLVRDGATVARALASRDADVEQGVSGAAATLRAIARERRSVQDTLSRAPAVLGRTSVTLRNLRATLAEVRPALREARPVAPRLARVLERLVPVSRAARPVLADTRALLPRLTVALSGLPALEPSAVGALRSATSSLDEAMPVLAGLRPYGFDLVSGFFNGFGGTAGGYYDANGNYGRIMLELGRPGLEGAAGSGPAGTGYSTGNDARCPGGASEPAPDGSNPWTDDPSLCDPEHDQP